MMLTVFFTQDMGLMLTINSYSLQDFLCILPSVELRHLIKASSMQCNVCIYLVVNASVE